jgi:dTDP-4-dehydrorhamnose 3,5-epimerase-like enzyme
MPGLIGIYPKRIIANRGHSTETFRVDDFRKCIGHVEFVRYNESLSRLKGGRFTVYIFNCLQLVK